MKSTNAWGGGHEIYVMSKLLDTSIQVYDGFKEVVTYNKEKKNYRKMRLLYEENNHYQFYQVEYSFLMKFVQSFLQSCETRLLVYSKFMKRAKQGDKIIQEGIEVDNIVKNFFFGYQGCKRKVHRAPLEKGNIVGVTKGFLGLSDLIETFNNYPLGFRKLLVHAAHDIFQSFEMQFEEIGFDYIPEVADNIVGKILKYYINKEYEESADTATIVEALVIEKYTQGETLVQYGEQYYDIRDLYENVGIVIEKVGDSFEYYRRNAQEKDKSSKYGYRRLFIDEKLREIYIHDAKAETRNENLAGYKYVLDRQNFQNTFEGVFSIINEEIQVPSKKIVSNCVGEVKFHIEEETKHLEKKIESCYRKRKQSLDVRVQSLVGKAEKLSGEKETRQSKRRLEVAKKNKDTISGIRSYLEGLQNQDYYSKLNRMFASHSETIFQKCKELSEPQRVDTAKPKPSQSKMKLLLAALKKVDINAHPQVKEFAGRQEEILGIYNELRQEKRAVAIISNQRGIGKTQLARKYASENKESYLHIYEVSTQNMARMENSLASLAKDKLGMSMEEETSLMRRKKSLFIFHDVRKEDLERVLRIGNRGGFNLLLTSDQDLQGVQKVELTALKGEESKELIKKILEIGDESQNEQIGILVEKLKGFPLAIKQATTCIRNKKLRDEVFGIREYLEEYNKKFNEESSQSIEQSEYDKVLLVTDLTQKK